MKELLIKISKSFLALLFVAVLVVNFNNCSFKQPFLTAEIGTFDSLNPPVPPDGNPDRLLGEKLYASNCASCHNPIETSTKKNKSFDDIKTAITDVGAMKFLSGLTDQEIQLVALALSPLTDPPDNEYKMASSVEVRVSNRFMLYSNLKEIFVADVQDTFDKSILNILNENIFSRPESFGGNCSRYDLGCSILKFCGLKGSDPCEADLVVKSTVSPHPTASVMRKGYTSRTCEEVLSIDKAVTTALGKAEVQTDQNKNPVPNATNISKLVSFFYMDKPTSAASIEELVKVAAQASSKGMGILDQWRFVMLPVCESALTDTL